MSGLPDFDDIQGGEVEQTEEKETKTRSNKDDHMFIKGRWGTKVVRRDDGCQVCGRYADAVLITNMVEGEVQPDYDRLVLVCDDHEGDVRGDLGHPPEKVQRRDF